MLQPHTPNYWLFTALLVVTPLVAQAEPSDFTIWQQEQQQSFNDFQSNEDKAFTAFLNAEWEEFQVFQGNIRDITPKPAQPPSISNSVSVRQDFSQQSKGQIRRATSGNSSNILNFFGHALEPLELPVKKLSGLNSPSNKEIAQAWSTLSSTDHSATLDALIHYKESLQLGDWALIKLTDQLLQQSFQSQNERNCYLWFLLTKLGYDIKIGYTKQNLVLLIPSSNKLYGVGYSLIDDTTYYMFPDPSNAKVFSYDGSVREGLPPFDLTLQRLISATQQIGHINFSYDYQGQNFPITIQYDEGLSEFLENYPQIDLNWYFTSPPGQPTDNSLHTQLQPIIKDMTPRETVNFLIGFTQYLFQYQTDQEQFGREKYLLIEESLRYGINDCEDRSIFLAWLIDNLLGLPLVILDYPGHVALAVRTDIRPDDDIVEYQGYKYIVADPTYIGAKIGMAMPSMLNSKPKILTVNYASTSNFTAQGRPAEKILRTSEKTHF